MQTGRNIVGKQLPTLLGQQCFELLRQFAHSLCNDSPLLYSFACGKVRGEVVTSRCHGSKIFG